MFLDPSSWSPDIGSSFEHAHVRDLHSLVLRPGLGMVRVYFADKGHELWKNEPSGEGDSFRFVYGVSVAAHTHRQDITLTPLFGHVVNVVLVPSRMGRRLYGFEHRSMILTGAGGFVRGDPRRFSLQRSQRMVSIEPMAARDFHTVFVPRGERAAWLVEEGTPDDGYDPTCYSNVDLTHFSFDGLYRRMAPSKAREIIDSCKTARASVS